MPRSLVSGLGKLGDRSLHLFEVDKPAIGRPLLTIAIPTFNRAQHLSSLLFSLVDDVRKDERIELLISDNASSDQTPDLISSIQRQGVPCRYLRNKENIGPDRNFLQCYREASGKYLWIMGDDDVIVPGAIERIMSYLAVDDFDLAYINSVFVNGDEQPVPNGLTNVSRPIVYTSAVALAQRVHVFFTFISGIIVNKEAIEKAEHRPFSDLLDSNLIQLGWTYTALRNHRKSLYFEDVLVVATGGNTGGYGLFRVFGEHLNKVTRDWLQDPKLYNPILNGTLRFFFPPFLLQARKSENARFAKEDPDKILRPFLGDNFRYWVFAYPLIVLPASIGRLWWLGIRAVNKFDILVARPLRTVCAQLKV